MIFKGKTQGDTEKSTAKHLNFRTKIDRPRQTEWLSYWKDKILFENVKIDELEFGNVNIEILEFGYIGL